MNNSLFEEHGAMATRTIEVFSAGCGVCTETIEMVQRAACPSCDVTVLDMREPDVARRAKDLGIRSVPAVVIDGKLADCCLGRGVDEVTLRAAGLGQPLQD
jgi:hypothetical protein